MTEYIEKCAIFVLMCIFGAIAFFLMTSNSNMTKSCMIALLQNPSVTSSTIVNGEKSLSIITEKIAYDLCKDWD